MKIKITSADKSEEKLFYGIDCQHFQRCRLGKMSYSGILRHGDFIKLSIYSMERR
jgi:hypothetical protein